MRYAEKLRYARLLTASITAAAVLILVVLPALYILGFIVTHWEEILREIFYNPVIGDTYWRDIIRFLSLSLRLSLSALLVDIVLGLALAYMLSTRRFRGLGVLEDLITLVLVLPTSGFGFAVLMTWAGTPLADALIPIVNVPAIAFLVHVALTLPYVVRTMTAALKSLDRNYEVVSRSLGASRLTTFRKVVLPMITRSLISGSTLALTRSLGETGATMVVIGVSVTASIAIVRWVFEGKLGPAAFLSAMLVAAVLLIVLPAEWLTRRRSGSARRLRLLPDRVDRGLIRFERAVPAYLSILRDLTAVSIFVVLAIAPLASLILDTYQFWSSDPYTGRFEGSVLYELFGPPNYYPKIVKGILTSLVVAFTATLVSTYLAIPTTLVIAKTRAGQILRSLLKIPLVIPTSALGLSSLLYWGSTGLVQPSIWLTILTHISFSVPIVVESMLSTYEAVKPDVLEETARTLGATPYDVAETIIVPLVKRGLLAGSILAFTHSLGETGATFIVMGRDITAPVLVVNMVEALAIPAAMFTALVLTLISLALLLVIRLLTRE